MTEQQKMSFDTSLLKIVVTAGAALLVTVSVPVLLLV